MTNLDNILKNRDITLPTKVHLVTAMVFPVVMYGCESWPIKKVERWRIDVLELWCWRRILRVLWTARKSNQSILKEISPEYSLQRRRQWHPTPVLLPGKFHGWRSLVGCSPWGCKESDTTERLHFHFSLPHIGEGNGNPLQCSCLENPRDGGAWWAAIYGVSQSRTRLKRLSSSSSSIHWKDWSWNSNILVTWCEKLTHWKRPWCWERLKAGGEGDDRGWDGWMASLTWWTWVWASSGSWWWTGNCGMLQSMESQRVRHNWVTELNWYLKIWLTLHIQDENITSPVRVWVQVYRWENWGSGFPWWFSG